MDDKLRLKIARENTLLRNALDSVPDMIAIKNVSGQYLVVNKAVNEYYKDRFDSIEGKTVDEIYPIDDAEVVKELDRQVIESKKPFRKKIKVYTDKGYIITDLTRAPIVDEEGSAIGVISVGKDITKQEEIYKELQRTRREYRQLAYYDVLTKVYNRRKFYEDFSKLKNGDEMILILTDLNNFKNVNDDLGHFQGDKTLKKIAAYLKQLFSKYNGSVYRFGGDEFAILYQHENRNIMEEENDNINGFLEKIHNKLSISYGSIIISDENVRNQVQMDLSIKRVDFLLYEYKRKFKSHNNVK